jgi:hypothetical protein
MSSGPGELGNLLKQAQDLQRAMEQVRSDLRAARLSGLGGGGAVRVEVDGEGMVHGVQIQPGIPAEARVLEEMVLNAAREAIGRAAKLRAERLAQVTGGIPLPWNF